MSDFKIVKLLDAPVQVVLTMGPDFTGAYDNGVTYTTGKSVSYNGSSYIAISTTTGNLPTDTTFWQLLASKGDAGVAGADGPAGADGINNAKILNGSGDPAGGLGDDNDFYVDSVSPNKFYLKELGAWVLKGTLQGNTGPAGSNGTNGANGIDGGPGPAGANGIDGADGTNGADGIDGISAYQVALNNGFVGTEAAWLLSLVGPAGADGVDGADGIDGGPGLTGPAGADGVDGISAYQVALNNGFVGTEAAWLLSLVGPAGADGINGADGADGIDGGPGPTGASGTNGINGADGVDGDPTAITVLDGGNPSSVLDAFSILDGGVIV